MIRNVIACCCAGLLLFQLAAVPMLLLAPAYGATTCTHCTQSDDCEDGWCPIDARDATKEATEPCPHHADDQKDADHQHNEDPASATEAHPAHTSHQTSMCGCSATPDLPVAVLTLEKWLTGPSVEVTATIRDSDPASGAYTERTSQFLVDDVFHPPDTPGNNWRA